MIFIWKNVNIKLISFKSDSAPDEFKAVAKLNDVYHYRINNIKNAEKYSFKCSKYRNYALCICKLKTVLPDDYFNLIIAMLRNAGNYEYCAETSRLPCPVQQSITKCLRIGLTEFQICSSLQYESPNLLVLSTKLTSLVQSECQNNHSQTFFCS